MSTRSPSNEYLFSYGTLQLERIQRELFGRLLNGTPDALPQFESALLKIEDPAEAAALGKTHHAIAKFTGSASDEIAGSVLELTLAELQQADSYEPPEYKRVAVVLRSGKRAWVYVDVSFAVEEGA